MGSKACRGKSSLALLAYVYCAVAFSDYGLDLGLELVFEIWAVYRICSKLEVNFLRTECNLVPHM